MLEDKHAVMNAFHAIETIGRERSDSEGPWQEPAFDVRLDAKRDIEARGYRIRVTAGSTDAMRLPTIEEWRAVLDVAERFGATVRLDNAALELR